MSAQFGLVLPAGPPTGAPEKWLDEMESLLPDLGEQVTGLWMTDHFFWDGLPTFEAWTVLSYAAARWTDYQIGPIVLGQGYRNPALLAKMAATLQCLSDGRFVLGLGAGWKEDEYDAYGYPFPSAAVRVSEVEEALTIITALWREPGRASFAGRHHTIREAYCEPKPDPVPPIMVGGGGNRMTTLAARFADWWSLPDCAPNVYEQRLQVLHANCERENREPLSLRLTWFGRLAVADSERAANELSDRVWTRERALVGTPQQVMEQVNAFEDLGVDYFMCDVLGLDNPLAKELFLSEILPHFAARNEPR